MIRGRWCDRMWDPTTLKCTRVLKDTAPNGLKPQGENGHMAAIWQLKQLEDGRSVGWLDWRLNRLWQNSEWWVRWQDHGLEA